MSNLKNVWGFTPKQNLEQDEVTQKQVNIWEQEANGVKILFLAIEVIPDMDQEIEKIRLENQKYSAPSQINQKVTDIKELENESKKYSLPQDDKIDMQMLLKFMRPYEELIEKDEQWEFFSLKSEINQIVKQQIKVNELYNKEKFN